MAVVHAVPDLQSPTGSLRIATAKEDLRGPFTLFLINYIRLNSASGGLRWPAYWSANGGSIATVVIAIVQCLKEPGDRLNAGAVDSSYPTTLQSDTSTHLAFQPVEIPSIHSRRIHGVTIGRSKCGNQLRNLGER